MTMRIDRETEHNCPMKHSVGSHYLICKSPIENMMSAGGVAAHRPSSNLSAQALETRAAKMPASQHRSNSNSVSLLMRELCVETLTLLSFDHSCLCKAGRHAAEDQKAESYVLKCKAGWYRVRSAEPGQHLRIELPDRTEAKAENLANASVFISNLAVVPNKNVVGRNLICSDANGWTDFYVSGSASPNLDDFADEYVSEFAPKVFLVGN